MIDVGGRSLEVTLWQRQKPEFISVRSFDCLAICTRVLRAAIRSPKAWTYIFGGGLHDATDVPARIAGARLAAAGDGIMPWRGRPEPPRRGLIARVPPLEEEGP